MKERITTIDNTKAIGIILVITGHAISEYNLEMRKLLNIIYSFHMPLFFIIHGIVKDYKKYKNTSKKNIYLIILKKTLNIIYSF